MDFGKYGSAFKKDVYRFAQNYIKGAAKEVQRLMLEKTRTVLQDWYADYDPRVYLRSNNLLNNSYRGYLVGNRWSWVGGIQLSSDFMDEYTDSVPGIYSYQRGCILDGVKDKVFEAAIMEGKHGYENTQKITTPTPYSALESYFNSNELLEAAIAAGDRAAKSAHYNLDYNF